MDSDDNDKDLIQFLESISDRTDPDAEEMAIILAAGQGRRIKSRTSKMLHTIWGKPTVARVCQAVEEGLGPHRQIIVLGVEARQVAEALGEKPGRIFIYQAEQLGTGHAVKIALEAQARTEPPKSIYILPGDMGLLSASTIRALKSDFGDNACHMMLLTGSYSGDPAKNHYGRIVRLPAEGDFGEDNLGVIVAIKEFKDIDALPENRTITIHHRRDQPSFSRSELLAISEFNTGAYVCRGREISRLIDDIEPSPATGEFYLTDLVELMNRNDLKVRGSRVADNRLVMGFNVKSALKYMERVAGEKIYKRLMDIVTIRDDSDFFIAEEVVEQILKLDSERGPLDIVIGQGAYIGPEVTLERGVVIDDRAKIAGRVLLGENVYIGPGAFLDTFPGQTIIIEKNVQIFEGNIIKGNLKICAGSRLERYVRVTGSDRRPTVIGKNVVIKGTSYLYGVIVEDGVKIEHSVIKAKRVARIERRDGSIQPVRYVLPQPEGLDSIEPL